MSSLSKLREYFESNPDINKKPQLIERINNSITNTEEIKTKMIKTINEKNGSELLKEDDTWTDIIDSIDKLKK